MVRSWTIKPYDKYFSKKLTVAPVQRIDIDKLVLSIILRNPENLPVDLLEDDLLNREMFLKNISHILDHIENMNNNHILLSEYAKLFQEREDIKVIEGIALNRPWAYSSIKSIHKNANNKVVEVEIFEDHCYVNEIRTQIENSFNVIGY